MKTKAINTLRWITKKNSKDRAGIEHKKMIAASTACLFLPSLCTRWIASARARAKTVFGHLIAWVGLILFNPEFVSRLNAINFNSLSCLRDCYGLSCIRKSKQSKKRWIVWSPNEANESRRPEAAVKEVYLAVFIWRPKNNIVVLVRFHKYEC